jgi:polysaccharide biosynthesis/export protein
MTTKVFIRRLNNCLIFAMMVLALFSCISQKKLEYIQDPVLTENVYQMHKKEILRIKPNDELYIRVSSFDDVAHNFFGTQTQANNASFGTEISISLLSYAVSDSGFIYFPILGHIYVKDLTINELTSKLKDLLSEYFNQPSVLVSLVNKRITVIGSVVRPGTYTYVKEHLNIFEAISLAGDATVHGNLKSVYLMRAINDSIKKVKIDLTNDNIFVSENYYLHPDDIIYVKPRPSLKWSVISVPISLTFSTITTALLIINYFKY